MALSTTEEIIEEFRQGRMVILMDDEDRENEGDLIMPATMVTPDDINFMARFGRGLICLTLTKARCQQLNLPLMVGNNGAQFSTNFTVSIEAAEGVTTGISAADRARTVQAAVASGAKASDVVQPGHIFPLMAQEGGVLTRAGHTEAVVDLTRMAGLQPGGALVEIMNDDGTMARLPDLEKLRQKNIKGKVVLEDFINNYCFCQMNFELMDKDALYIITDKYPEIVAVYKGLIDKLSLEHNIIYIASASHMLPLKFGCVDLYIDLDSANEYALYNDGYSTEALKNYFNKDSSALGLFFSFKPKSSSFAELHKQFPEAWEKSYDISYFRQHLRKTWKQVLDEEAIGKVTDSTQEEIAYSYHIPGEVGVDVYHVEGFSTERMSK